MSRSIGIHLSDDTLRLVCLEGGPGGCALRALSEARLPLPFRPAVVRRATDRRRLADGIGPALAGMEAGSGELHVALGGGFYHLQKVPLEVASQEDRRDQIAWEASQTLIGPASDYLVDYHPAGRSAFWVAVHREAFDLCSDLFARLGVAVDSFEVEPMGLFYACRLTQRWADGRNAAVLLGSVWLSFVSTDGGLLTGAETAYVDGQSVSAAAGPSDPDPDLAREEAFETVRRWIYGDRAPDRRQTAYSQVFFSGEQKQTLNLIRRLQSPASPELAALQPFAACNTSALPEPQRPLLARQCAFGVAAGLAYRALEKETP